jgi:hypothetical protein
MAFLQQAAHQEAEEVSDLRQPEGTSGSPQFPLPHQAGSGVGRVERHRVLSQVPQAVCPLGRLGLLQPVHQGRRENLATEDQVSQGHAQTE